MMMEFPPARTLAHVVRRHRGAYPLLEQSIQDGALQATSPKVEWVTAPHVEHPQAVDADTLVKVDVHHNFTEIFRGPSPENVAAQIEAALCRGQRGYAGRIRTMGGIFSREFGVEEGSAATKIKNFRLSILRDLQRIEDYDWVAEVTVIVYADGTG